MNALSLDFRLALRSLAKRPGPTLVMVVTLAVGLGVNAAIFGVLDALVIRPFRFFDTPHLILVAETEPEREMDNTNVAPANFLDLRRESRGLVEALVGFTGWDVNLIGADGPEQVNGSHASVELFDTLRVQPVLGRFFTPEDGKANGGKVVVLGDDFWRRQFAADRGIVGRVIDLSGESYQVIGVAPRSFQFPPATDVWAPLTFTPEEAADRESHYLGVLGRLAPGVALSTANARFHLAGDQLQKLHPDTNAGRGAEAMTLIEGMRDAGTPSIIVLWQAAAGFVLLIGWVNLANLMLARASERQRDLAVLEALGAGRSRLVRTLLTEGIVVALTSAALAVPIAMLSMQLMRDAMPPTIRRWISGWEEMAVDGRTFLFTLGLALASVIAFNVWPALRTVGPRLGRGFQASQRGGVSVGAQRGRSALVVCEVAAGLVLLVAAGLSARAALRLLDGPQGYDPDHLLSLKLSLPDARYSERASQSEFVRRALDRIAAVPGVQAAAAANVMPATGNNSTWKIEVEGEPIADRSNPPRADGRAVSADYFSTLRMPIVAGRALSVRDGADAAPVAVVSRSFAERHWPGKDPLGRRFRLQEGDDEPWRAVVGVAGDHIHHWFDRRGYPTVFLPLAQRPRQRLTFEVRTLGPPEAAGREVRKAILAIDPYQPVYEVRSQRRSIHEATIGLQYVAAVMSAFAFFGVLLAVSGVYAVMAYRVNLRRREIGVRVALGASRRDVLGLTLGQSLRLTAIGLGLGSLGSFAVGRVLVGVLRGATELDPLLLGGGIALLGAAMFLAAVVPTRRALAIDPAKVLRAE